MTTAKAHRPALSAIQLHAMVLAQSAAEQSAIQSGTTKVLSVKVDMKGGEVRAKGEARVAAKVSAQRVGVEVTINGAPREKGPIPNGLLLPGTYSAEQFLLLMLHAGKRQVHEMVAGRLAPVTYSNGSPKMTCDPQARVIDEQVAISGFVGYYQPHMDGSREAGPHGVQLAAAIAKAYALTNSGRGTAKMSGVGFPMAPNASLIKTWHRGASATLAGFTSHVKGLPAPAQKTLNDLLKREELGAQTIAHHKFASDRLLAAIADEEDDAKAEAMSKDYDFHQSRCALEHERVIEIRRQLASRGITIPAMLLEKDFGDADLGDEELRTPSAHSTEPVAVQHDADACEDESCEVCFEDVDDAEEVIQTVQPETVDACAPTLRDPLAATQVNPAFDDDGVIIEASKPKPTIAEQIEAMKAANAALRAEQAAPAPTAAKGKAVVVSPIIDVDADTTDDDLRALLDSL